MTGQIPDKFLYQGQEYVLAGMSGGPLFVPGDYGLHPFSRVTSCWRGYVCTYALDDDRLILDQLEVNLCGQGMTNPGSPINGVTPIEPGKEALFDNIYQRVRLAIPYTGSLEIAQGFIRALYVHMGFQPAWKYEQVLELKFEEGRLGEARDISELMAEIRKYEATNLHGKQ